MRLAAALLAALAAPPVRTERPAQAIEAVPRLRLLGGGHMPMSGLGLCCRPTAQGDPVRQATLDYLLMGGRLLDTAQLYNNHREVGEGIRQAMAQGVPRHEIWITTKIWPDRFGFEDASAWVGEMLQELGVDYVDLVLLHKAEAHKGKPCGEPKNCRQETWLALDRARAKGQIGSLGVSNFGPRQMEELMGVGGAPVSVNQLEYHPWIPDKHRETVAWCHEHKIAVTAYGSMGSMSLASQLMSQDALRQIGDMHGKSAGQVLLRWALEKNVSVIPGTSNPKHMTENLQVFDFALNDEVMGFLDAIPEDQRMLHFGHTPDAHP